MVDTFTKIIYNKMSKIINEQGVPSMPIPPDQSALPGTPPGTAPGAKQPPATPPTAASPAKPDNVPNEQENTDRADAEKVITNLSVVSPDDFNEWLSPPGRGSTISDGEEERAKLLYSKLHDLFLFMDDVNETIESLESEGVGA